MRGAIKAVTAAILNFIAGFFSLVYIFAIFLYTFGFFLVYKSAKEKSWSKFFFGIITLVVNFIAIWLTYNWIHGMIST